MLKSTSWEVRYDRVTDIWWGSPTVNWRHRNPWLAIPPQPYRQVAVKEVEVQHHRPLLHLERGLYRSAIGTQASAAGLISRMGWHDI